MSFADDAWTPVQEIAAQLWRESADQAQLAPSIDWLLLRQHLETAEMCISEVATGPLRERFDAGERSRELAEAIQQKARW